MAKQSLNDYNQETDKKELAKENFRKVFKVWQAFVKFLRSQVEVKGKMVNTHYIGHFVKYEEQILYLPTSDFIEAGKFKFK